MGDPQFWTSFFASSGAAVIAFGSAAWSFSRSRRADRRDVAARERRERVGRVQTAVHSDLINAAVAWRGLRIGSGVIRVTEAVGQFATAEWIEHEAVARWSMWRLTAVASCVTAAERWWLLPGHTARRQAVLEPAADLATALALWEHGVLDDDWFAERLPEDERDALISRRRGRATFRRRPWRQRDA